jgi:regulator of protease activity HflC (stomatin/prohibitin superfamily)
MAVQTSAGTGQQLAAPPVAEYRARATRGTKVLVGGVVLVIAGVAVLVNANKHTGATTTALVWLGILLIIIATLGLAGLTPVAPGQARVIQLFGKYRGTVREPGMQWVNPFTHRIKVSTRIRNHETAQAKVNDADGNPIEIAAVVVWQVHDTAKAIYAVDEYTKFVAIQTETAVRHIASSYPYTSHDGATLSLRDNAEEITGRLSAEIAARVASAGVAIIESRLTRLSYAASSAPG